MEIVLSIIAGLVLFLYAVNHLSETLSGLAGDNTKKWLERFTKNTLSSIITGTIVTTLLDSSSAVIIITIVMINSGILNFRNAMGIILGANIGTTFSSQIIAMDIGKYSPILLALGLILVFISKSENISKSGKLFLYFGMLFFGLFTMERAVEPLRESVAFVEWMHKLENPLQGAGTGALLTLIIQSSSATVGMAIVLAKKGLLTLPAGIAVMMGAEIGTCSDTLLATIKGSRQAIKTGLFHLIFNITSVILGLIFIHQFTSLINWSFPKASPEHLLANAHMLFNIFGVVLFAFLIPTFEKILNKMLPEKRLHASTTQLSH
jgi:phosphate:Na+ symporter